MIKYTRSVIDHFRNTNTSRCKSLFITSTAPVAGSFTNSESEAEMNMNPYQVKIKQQVEKTKFHIGLQHNIPLIQSTITPAYPTQETIESTIDLAKRSGATSRIIAVGSRGAIDLAKAVTLALNGDNVDGDKSTPIVEEMILIPSTLGAVMACTMTDTLVYNMHEEGLCLPSGLKSSYISDSNPFAFQNTSKVIIAPENSVFNSNIITFESNGDIISQLKEQKQPLPPTIDDAAYAVLTLCVDTAVSLSLSSSSPNNEALLKNATQNAISALKTEVEDEESKLQKQIYITNALILAGQIFNLTNFENFKKHDSNHTLARRSVPLALASALLPTYYPNVNLLTFLATLLPGLCDVYHSQKTIPVISMINKSLSKITPPSLASQMESRHPPDLQTMLDKIDGNLILWDHYEDESEEILEEILHRSLNR